MQIPKAQYEKHTVSTDKTTNDAAMKQAPVEVPDDTCAVLSGADKHAVRLAQLQASDAVGMSKQTQWMIENLQTQLLAWTQTHASTDAAWTTSHC